MQQSIGHGIVVLALSGNKAEFAMREWVKVGRPIKEARYHKEMHMPLGRPMKSWQYQFMVSWFC
jgi:hypothetical protein